MKVAAAFANTTIGVDFDAIRRLVVGIEQIGFDGVSTNDHVIGAHPDRSNGVTMNTVDTAVHEPLVLLSMIAASNHTTRSCHGNSDRTTTPDRAAGQADRQLDLLSKGCVPLGVGIGRNWIEYESLGQDFTTRGKRMEEQVQVLRLLWGNDLVTFDGRFHTLDRVGINPRSIRDSIPIWMGSYAKQLHEPVLERIGRIADGWMPQFPPAELAPALQRLRGYAEGAGRDPDSLGIECVVRAKPGDSPDDWRTVAERYRELGATHLKVYATARCDSGTEGRLDLLGQWHQAVAAAV